MLCSACPQLILRPDSNCGGKHDFQRGQTSCITVTMETDHALKAGLTLAVAELGLVSALWDLSLVRDTFSIRGGKNMSQR